MKIIESTKVNNTPCYVVDLTIETRGINSASCSSWVCNGAMKEALILLDGTTVRARAFSGTNICFDITEEMIDTAWEARKDSEPYTHYADHWKEIVLKEIKDKFCSDSGRFGRLSCSLPNAHCKEFPRDIQKAIDEATK